MVLIVSCLSLFNKKEDKVSIAPYKKANAFYIEVFVNKQRVEADVRLKGEVNRTGELLDDNIYCFPNVGDGDYILEVSKEGYDRSLSDISIKDQGSLYRGAREIHLVENLNSKYISLLEDSHLVLRGDVEHLLTPSKGFVKLTREHLGKYTGYIYGSKYSFDIFSRDRQILAIIDGVESSVVYPKRVSFKEVISISPSVYRYLKEKQINFSWEKDKVISDKVEITEKEISLFWNFTTLGLKGPEISFNLSIKIGDFNFPFSIDYLYDKTFLYKKSLKRLSINEDLNVYKLKSNYNIYGEYLNFKSSSKIFYKFLDSGDRESSKIEVSVYGSSNIATLISTKFKELEIDFSRDTEIKLEPKKDRFRDIKSPPFRGVEFNSNYSSKVYVVRKIEKHIFEIIAELDKPLVEIKNGHTSIRRDIYIMPLEYIGERLISQSLLFWYFSSFNNVLDIDKLTLTPFYNNLVNMSGKLYIPMDNHMLRDIFKQAILKKPYIDQVILQISKSKEELPGAFLKITESSIESGGALKLIDGSIEFDVALCGVEHTRYITKKSYIIKIFTSNVPPKVKLREDQNIHTYNSYRFGRVGHSQILCRDRIYETVYSKSFTCEHFFSSKTYIMQFSYSEKNENPNGYSLFKDSIVDSMGSSLLILKDAPDSNFVQSFVKDSKNNNILSGLSLGDNTFSKALSLVFGVAELLKPSKYIPGSCFSKQFEGVNGQIIGRISSEKELNYSLNWEAYVYYEGGLGEIFVERGRNDVRVKREFTLVVEEEKYVEENINGKISSIGDKPRENNWYKLMVFVKKVGLKRSPWSVRIPFPFQFFRHTKMEIYDLEDQFARIITKK